jgi:hypothetical protein
MGTTRRDAAGNPGRLPALLDSVHFDSTRSWTERLSTLAESDAFEDAFKAANLQIVPRVLAADQPGLRAVINIGARSLCSFLADTHYRNAYERSAVVGVEHTARPSERRVAVDQLLFGDDGREYYYAAVSLGGVGCRFYGEFCLVLRQSETRNAGVFDRNSYDLTVPPLDAAEAREELVRALRGTWTEDVIAMLTVKVAPELPSGNRLTTPGQLSDLVLRDEDFAEVHLRQKITRDSIEEVRKSPEESSVALELLEQYRAGDIPTPAELVWASNRHRAEEMLRDLDIPTRSVATNGRGFRWR